MNGRGWIAVVAAGAALALGLGYWAFFVRPEEKAESPPAAPTEMLVIRSLSGQVEVAGADGKWRPARAGERLSVADRIRTDDEGTAELRAADGSTVKLQAASDARVAELRRELLHLRLGTGMVEADVRDDPTRVFEIELDDRGAVARTRGARFSASANGAGTAAVATRRGEVTLSARGREVVIRTGQFARIAPGAPPEPPRPVPGSLFLKVEWPPGASSRKPVTVRGQTEPGARVKVAGRYVAVDADGKYHADLSLPDGTHQLRVHAVDVVGHVADEKSPKIIVDTTTDFTIQRPTWK